MAGVGLVLALGGCGVSASSEPRKIGNAYEPIAGPNYARPLAEPTAADPAQLVEEYLHAAAGGNEAAIAQVKLFLTDNGRKTWNAGGKSTATTIRIIHVDDVTTQAQGDNGTPVDLKYHEIGTLNATTEDGRITPSNNTQEQNQRLQVVRAADQVGQLRIDSGALPGLVLSDDALDGPNGFYSPQPIYFWDASNQVLVPDLRYVPLTVPTDQRANKVIFWLQNGPSQLLGDGVNKPLVNTNVTVGSRGSTLVIKLSPQAGVKGLEDARHLVYQLQASLNPVTGNRDLEIWIGNNQAPATGPSDYQKYELSSRLPVPMQKYDIVDGVVKPAASDSVTTAPELQMLGAKENSAVEYAAINRDDSMGAFVRATSPNQTLALIPNSGKTITVRGLPQSDQTSRPAWIPSINGINGVNGLLVAWGGGLYLVSLDGQASRVPTTGLGAITEVTVSPDGRRVAMMAGGQVTVAALVASPNGQSAPSVQLADGQPQIILPEPGLTPYAVAWESEQRVYIVGRSSTGKPALWRVTIDGAAASNLSDELKDVAPVDVVSYPKGPSAGLSEGEIVVMPPPSQSGPAVPYRVRSPQVIPDGTRNPFYVD
jgi:hypothetical protein